MNIIRLKLISNGIYARHLYLKKSLSCLRDSCYRQTTKSAKNLYKTTFFIKK